MSYPSLTILLPCHSLEDFPVHHQGPDADNLLSAWTALWHPALIAGTENGPQWRRADDPPDDLAGQLLAVPDVAMRELPSGFLQRAKSEGAIVLRSGTRETMLALALEAAENVERFDPELVADFLALGYCFLQVELLTRQMRYASNLDEIHFRHQLVEGAKAAGEGDDGRAREKLASCFDMLSTERDHYYSVDVYLIDLTLVAETTLGASLQSELARPHPTNVMLAAELLPRMASEYPKTMVALREALQANRCALAGGEWSEERWPLLDLEALAANLQRGLAQFEGQLNERPRVFGRRRSGLTPLFPQVLQRCQLPSALHIALDGGRIPQGSQFKTRWEGADGTTIDAIARSPLDASEPGNFLALAHKLGESMDMDHVASLCLAHWPGQASRWHDELWRVSRHTSALGKFFLLDSYFPDTMLPGRLDRFDAVQYRCDYLKPAVIRREENPLSSVAVYWHNLAARRAAEALETWGTVLGAAAIEGELPAMGSDTAPSDTEPFHSALQRRAERLARTLAKPDPSSRACRVLFNPLPATRRVIVATAAPPASAAGSASPVAGSPVVQGPVVATDVDALTGATHTAVDVPGWGFAVIRPGNSNAPVKKTRRKRQLIASDLVLKNDVFEARVHPETGGLASVRSFNSRVNLMSQQLAFRLARPMAGELAGDLPDTSPYTRMVAHTVEITANSALYGAIESRGVLLDLDGSEVATFQQRTSVAVGQRVIRLEIGLEPLREPRADPWNSYFACRFAWGDETAAISRSLQETRQRAEPGRLDAPLFVEIDNGRVRVAVLTGGMPFHRLPGDRMLDSLLVVRGETHRSFTLGLAVDVPHPLVEAHELLLPQEMLQVSAELPDQLTAGWLFNVGARNILATAWQPLVEQGRARGFRVRLLETSGKATRSTLSAFRAIRAARQLDLRGSACGDFGIDEGKVVLNLGPCEWVEVEAEFA